MPLPTFNLPHRDIISIGGGGGRKTPLTIGMQLEKDGWAVCREKWTTDEYRELSTIRKFFTKRKPERIVSKTFNKIDFKVEITYEYGFEDSWKIFYKDKYSDGGWSNSFNLPSLQQIMREQIIESFLDDKKIKLKK